jgi:hypothetical protein
VFDAEVAGFGLARDGSFGGCGCEAVEVERLGDRGVDVVAGHRVFGVVEVYGAVQFDHGEAIAIGEQVNAHEVGAEHAGGSECERAAAGGTTGSGVPPRLMLVRQSLDRRVRAARPAFGHQSCASAQTE